METHLPTTRDRQQLVMHLPGLVCDYCGQLSFEPVHIVKHFGRHTYQYAFCTESHAADFYAELQATLRESGL